MAIPPDEVEEVKKRYEDIAKNTVRQHWVPRFYLKNFSIDNTREKVVMYRQAVEPTLVGVNNIAVSKNLYTFEQKEGGTTKVFEGIFAEHEGEACRVIDKILEDKVLPTEEGDRSHLAAFVSMLRVRGPSFSDWLRNMEAEHLKLIQQIRAEHSKTLRADFDEAGITFSTDEEFEELRAFMKDPEKYDVTMEGGDGHYFGQAMELGKEIYTILMSAKSWHLLISPANRHFITSDNPVVIQKPEDCPPHLAEGFGNGTVILTLSPRICLVFRTVPLDSEIISVNRSDVDSINSSIADASRRQIYSNIISRDLMALSGKFQTGDESKVKIKRLASFSPYYMSSGKPLFDEAAIFSRRSVAKD